MWDNGTPVVLRTTFLRDLQVRFLAWAFVEKLDNKLFKLLLTASVMELAKFLVKAKRNTYASGDKPKKLANGFEEFYYEEGELKYKDCYHAKDPKPFGGEEVVWYNEKAVWMMNYYGYMLSDKINSKSVYEFLRKAMCLVNEKKPFRGPSNFKEGDFEYEDQNEGDVNRFKGVERIFFKGKEVYRLEYHGGSL